MFSIKTKLFFSNNFIIICANCNIINIWFNNTFIITSFNSITIFVIQRQYTILHFHSIISFHIKFHSLCSINIFCSRQHTLWLHINFIIFITILYNCFTICIERNFIISNCNSTTISLCNTLSRRQNATIFCNIHCFIINLQTYICVITYIQWLHSCVRHIQLTIRIFYSYSINANTNFLFA